MIVLYDQMTIFMPQRAEPYNSLLVSVSGAESRKPLKTRVANCNASRHQH